jgi:acyl-CoA thioester hydrolase
MEGYSVVFEHEILFRDLDLFGHMNNVTSMALMEDARVAYWKALRKGADPKKINFILARITCSYRSPAYFGETLVIGIRVSRVGNKSFDFEYRIEEKTSGRLVGEGSSVQVMYDYRGRRSLPVDAETCEAFAALERLPVAKLCSESGEDRPAGRA